jgi:FlaA1/EpsC-like NDP-sugar epimerase
MAVWAGVGLRPRTAHARRVLQVCIDSTAWALALSACAILRLGPGDMHIARMIAIFPSILLVQLIAGYICGLYRGRAIFGSFEEVATLGRVVLVSGSAFFLLDAAITRERPIPLSSVVAGAAIAFLLMGAARYWWRMVYDRSLRPTPSGSRVIVFGAGDGGQRAIQAMLRDPDSPYIPVVMLDDDPRVHGARFMGVRVVGDRDKMSEAARRYEASTILLALPAASGAVIRELTDLAQHCKLAVRVLPSVRELLDGEVDVADIRKPNARDLLGRHHIETDLEMVAHYIRGRRVAVTGAGGSIGSELCRQLAAFEPAELIMIDRDESALHSVQLSIEGKAMLDTPSTVLLDIRDRARVKRLFLERRPEIVFHAGALKHLPLLESYPVEALKTNVWGTLAVLEASAAAGVSRFVNISTDKAANPCSTLGYSKRVAEGLTAGVNKIAEGKYISVRFGNVLGSRGSVLTTFNTQLESGGPLTVTDPDVTRFFMTVEEAVQLVVQAAGIGNGGEVLVLDMGEPVRIADVAEQLAHTVDPPCPISFVGLRPGEKLHEELFGDGEVPRYSSHPLIRSVAVPALYGDDVRHLDPTIESETAIKTLMQLCLSMSIELLPTIDLSDVAAVEQLHPVVDDVGSAVGGD